MFIYVEDILSLALGNSEEHSKILELSIIIINYILIVRNACNNYIM